jgi:uncharacterized membrane protein
LAADGADAPHHVDEGAVAGVDAHTEEGVRRFIQLVLRAGLGLAVALMLVGLVLQLATGSDAAQETRLFSIGRHMAAGDTTMALGVLVLALTPVFRVLALIVLWARERDWHYTRVAAVVLLVLGVAAALGHG